jgi:hypothetical protein
MLKYDVVIGRTTNNPGTAVDVNALEITLYKSEELDFGVFTIPATTRFENYQILDRVDITVTDGSTTKVYDPFLVISDEVSPVSKKGFYKHTVTFIEDIHKFDKILSSNVFFTQSLIGPKKTLLDALNHVRDVVPFERASVHSQTRLFDIDSELAIFLDDIEAPQFFFSGMNLREMINAIASYVNAIGRMEENRNLVFSFYNELLGLFDVNEDVINRTLKNQTKYFTSAVESGIENATGGDSPDKASIIYPSGDGFVSMRSTDLKLTDETFEFRLPYPIERIRKIEYKTRLNYPFYFEVSTFNDLLNLDENDDWEINIPGRFLQTTLFRTAVDDKYYGYNKSGRTIVRNGVVVPNENFFEIDVVGEVELYPIPPFNEIGANFYEIFDVTPHIYEFNNYKQLNLDEADGSVRRIQDLQSNTMHYQINGKTISNNRLFGMFDGQSVIESFYLRVLYANGHSAPDDIIPTEDILFNTALVPTFNESNPAKRNDWNEQEFRFTYVPYFSTRVRLNKDDVTDHPYNTQMSANQGERIVSAERLLRNIYGMAQRLGQDEIEFKRFYTDLGEMFELGQITADGFVIASKHITYYLNYYIVTYLLSKNFNRFANRIALNQENRPFDIGRGSQTTTRNLLYNEYVELDTEPKENTSLIRNLGVGTFMNTLRPSPISTLNRPIRYGIFAGAEIADVLSSEGILITPVTFSEGNALNFYWSFDDVVKAGDRLNLSIYGNPPKFLGIELPTPQVYNNRNIRYTDNNEELNNFELSFGFELPEVIPDDLPIVSIPSDSLSSIGGHSFNGVFNDNFLVKKDKSEILSMNYILSVLPNFRYNNKIVVGRELTFSNNLIIANKNANLLIYTSENETYNSIENLFVKGTATPYTYAVSIEQGSGKIVADIPNIQNLASWAIGDDEGNLYLGVNVDTDLTSIIYFNFRNKRENISYTFDDIDIVGLVAPRNLVLTPTETTIVATWEDDQVSDFYEIGIRTIAPFLTGYTTIPDYPGNLPKTWTFTGLTQGFTYQVRIRSIKDGIPSFYISQSATTLAQPAKVQNFALNRILGNNTALAASWSPISNITGYNAQFRLASRNWTTGPVTQQNVGSNQTTTNQGVGVNNILVGRVRGQNAFGFGDFSDEDVNVIPLVTGRGVTPLSDTVIRASWNPLTNLFEPTINQEIGFEIETIDFVEFDSGTTTAGGINQISDTTKSFTPNALIGKIVFISSGIHANKTATITSNTATTIVFTPSIASSPAELQGVGYGILEPNTTPLRTDRVLYTEEFFDITGLTLNSFYQVGIRAYYEYIDVNFGKTVFSDKQIFNVKTLDEQLPAEVLAPVITVASGFPTQSSIRWNINNPNPFTVNRAFEIRTGTQVVTPSDYGATIAANSTVSVTLDSLGTNEQRTISARFRVGADPNFVFSNVSSNTATTLPPDPPPAPTSVTVTDVTATGVSIQWTFVSQATNGYDIEIETTAGVPVVTSATLSNLVVTFSYNLLDPNTDYRVRVRSRGVDGSAPSAYTAYAFFTTLQGAPPRPTSLSLSKTGTGQITATWTSVSSATSYDFQLSDSLSFSNIISNQPNISGTSAVVSGLFPATYYGRVRAKNSFGDSDWRVSAAFTLTA